MIVEVIAPAPTVLEITEPDPNQVEVSYVRGLKGDQGEEGIQGATGATGATGSTGATGAQGSSGVVSVTAPITNTGTSTAANIGIDQSGLTLAQSQITNLLTDLGAKAALTAVQTFTGQQTIQTSAAGNKGLIIKRTASQTANLLEVQLENGTILSRIDSSGDIYAGLIRSSYQLISFSGGAAIIPMQVRGAASQSANLQEWQNSSGTVIARIEPSGRFGNTGGSYIGGPNGQVFATTTSASTIPLISRGAASQTANLQEWQNSAGTVIAKIDSQGQLTSSGLYTTNNYGVLGEQNAGATLRMTKASSAQTNPGSGVARLYFRDGTNAGTLKLVVRAGTAGAETTILDNIPQ